MTRFLFLLPALLVFASGAVAQTPTDVDLIDADFDVGVYDDVRGEIIDIEDAHTPEVTAAPSTRALLDLLTSDDQGAALLRFALRAMTTEAQPLNGPTDVMQPLGLPARPIERVAFDVSGVASGAATAFLLDLSRADALGSLSAESTPDGDTRVQARFSFESADEWAEWRSRPETEALLSALSAGSAPARTELSVTRLNR